MTAILSFEGNRSPTAPTRIPAPCAVKIWFSHDRRLPEYWLPPAESAIQDGGFCCWYSPFLFRHRQKLRFGSALRISAIRRRNTPGCRFLYPKSRATKAVSHHCSSTPNSILRNESNPPVPASAAKSFREYGFPKNSKKRK